jgi:hypothetical protein
MKIKSIITSLTLVLSLLISGAYSASASATAKAGQKCSKVGVVTGEGDKTLTCKKVKKKLKWVKTPTNTIGTARNPVPFGSKLKIGGLEYTIKAINNNADAEICKGNAFNEGCTFDSDFNTVVDPKSTVSWLTVEVSVTNTANEILKPSGFDINYYLVLTNGQLLESELFVSFPASISEVQVIPGGTGSGQVAFPLPKSGNAPSNLLVIRDRSNILSAKDYYFAIK